MSRLSSNIDLPCQVIIDISLTYKTGLRIVYPSKRKEDNELDIERLRSQTESVSFMILKL
jgi:hypothetical protein